MPKVSGDRLLFLGGLHRSGTSIVHRLLRAHPDASGFSRTGVPQDEGQLLQSVYPAAWAFGGPGRFAFRQEAHLTEVSEFVNEANRAKLLCEWGAYYDLSRTVLLEKSPPNLIWSRFLQALFPGARFVFLVRHPIPVALATLKWSKSSVPELLAHWSTAHRILLEDLDSIERAMVLRYEDFVADAGRWLGAVCRFAGLPQLQPVEAVDNFNGKYFMAWERGTDDLTDSLKRVEERDGETMARFGYGLSPPYVMDWHPLEPCGRSEPCT